MTRAKNVVLISINSSFLNVSSDSAHLLRQVKIHGEIIKGQILVGSLTTNPRTRKLKLGTGRVPEKMAEFYRRRKSTSQQRLTFP